MMSFESEVDFCLNYLRSIDGSENKSIYSPSSLLNALAIIFTGADGSTANEINNVIGKDLSKKVIIDYYSHINDRDKISTESDDDDSEPQQKRQKRDSSTPEPENSSVEYFKVIVANRLFIGKNIKPLETFIKVVEENFHNKILEIDFAKSDNAAKLINTYVTEATNGMIDKLFDSNDLDEQTSTVLINVVYFIARWETKFNPRHLGIFYSKNNEKRRIEMMSATLYYINYNEGETWTSIGIPYMNDKYFMYIVLPKEKDGLENLIKSMDFEMFMKFTDTDDENYDNLIVTIPVFEISNTFDLTTVLPKLGIHQLFEKNSCDLSQMFLQPHFVDKAIHKVIIKVDEYGTEAAAVTTASKRPMCSHPSETFTANSPFLYFIISTEKNKNSSKSKMPTNILFAGTFL